MFKNSSINTREAVSVMDSDRIASQYPTRACLPARMAHGLPRSILYFKNGVRKIVFQHEHEDFWQALRTRGVLPAQG